jgi:hypothetical protein
MSHFEFNPWGAESIILEFDCDNCGNHVASERIFVPAPNYAAERSRDSQVEEEGHAICSQCDKQFDIDIYVSFGGGNGTIHDLSSDALIEVNEFHVPPYDEDQYSAISSNTQFFETFKSELANLNQLTQLGISNRSLEKTLLRQMYIGIIASMETYLSDAFINTVTASDIRVRKFVETFHGFKKETVFLSRIFEERENILDRCKAAMLGVIYHNIDVASGMYRDTLDVDFGDISTMSKAVATRHDLVHRNGKSKDGNLIELDQGKITQLSSEVERFINNVDQQIKAKHPSIWTGEDLPGSL